MNFDLSPQQVSLQEDMARFAADTLNGDVVSRDATQTFSRDGWLACAKRGLLGINAPSQYGGAGADLVTTVAALEGLGYGCRDGGLIFGIGAQMWSVQTAILQQGNEDQKVRYLPRLINGSLIGAHAMTEPEAGSDALALSTTAERSDGGYVLNGAKVFVTNAPIAGLFLVFATLAKSEGFMGVTAFLVDRDAPGLEVSKPIEKMGLRTIPMGEVVLKDCFVQADSLLGAERQGAAIFSSSMDYERAFIFAGTLGAMAFQLDRCAAYAKERRQAGRPIGDLEPVASRLAEMKLRLDTSRLLVYRVAALKDQGAACTMEAAMAKLHVSEAWHRSCLDAIRIHGGRGFKVDEGLERDLRDAIGGLTYSGTSDIQRNIISRLLLSGR